MARLSFLLALALAASPEQAVSSGVSSPSSSQLTYSFVCESGASAQISYARSRQQGETRPSLTALVNGHYIQDHADLVAALRGKIVQAISGGCQGDQVVVFLDLYNPNGGGDLESRRAVVTVYVSKAGKVVVAA